MQHTYGVGQAVWAIFSYQVVSDLVKGTFSLLSTRVGSLCLIIGIGMYAWHVLGPEPKSLDSTRRAVADTVCAEALAKMPYDKSVYRVAVLPFERDYTSYITDTLRRGLSDTGRYNVSDKGFWERLKKRLGRDPGEVAGVAAALRAGKKLGVDAVVFGSVPEQAQDGGQAGIRLNVSMVRVAGEETLAEFTVEHGLSKSLISPGYVEAQIHNTGLLGRIVLWSLVCLALPVVFSFVVRRITHRDSNVWNFLMLAGFVLVNLVTAVLIVGVSLTTFRGWLGVVLVLIVSGLYNYAACTRIDDLAR